MEREQHLKEIYNEIGANNRGVQYTFLSFGSDKRTVAYYQAFKKLKAMDPDDFSIKVATFIIEDAFYENQMDKGEFDRTISNIGNFISDAMREQGLGPENNLTKNLSIYQFIADTLTVNGKPHHPYTYDFDDYMGRENWDNMFVSKLLYEGSGQCNSMPRLYLILAEELKAESYLAFAPNHSFIRFKNHIGEWYNAELTSGAIMSDIFMLDSGFMKAETVQNGNYTKALNEKESLALLLIDLAQGYQRRSPYNDGAFILQSCSTALEYYPNLINAILLRLETTKMGLERMAEERGIPLEKVFDEPKAKEIWIEL